jgi:DNA-binding SARP family transcriptional activator
MLLLELLGTLALRSETPPVPVSAQQKRSLGLLAILALAGRQGFPRDRIESYLWPESSAPLARHSLDQTVYAIRHALGSDLILSTGRELRLNPGLVQVDLWKFEEAIRAHQWAAAVDSYKGTLLEGFYSPTAASSSHGLTANALDFEQSTKQQSNRLPKQRPRPATTRSA